MSFLKGEKADINSHITEKKTMYIIMFTTVTDVSFTIAVNGVFLSGISALTGLIDIGALLLRHIANKKTDKI